MINKYNYLTSVNITLVFLCSKTFFSILVNLKFAIYMSYTFHHLTKTVQVFRFTGPREPRPTALSVVRVLPCLALKKRLSIERRLFNETSGIRIRVSSTKPYRKELRNSSIWIGNQIGNHFIPLLGKLFKQNL